MNTIFDYLNDLTNEDRAEAAEQAICTFEDVISTDREFVLTDLLCDLMHWAEREGRNFERALTVARVHYCDEANEESNMAVLEQDGEVTYEL